MKNYKILLFSIFLLMISKLSHAGNIVVLSALDLSDKKLAKISRYTYEYYQHRTNDIIIHHRASAVDLGHYLRSESTEKLFWVSHSANSKEIESGVQTEDIILDFYGNNVKDLFTNIHPNINFLAIVGCKAKSIIEGFEQAAHYSSHRYLDIYSFHKRTKLYGGFKKAMKVSLGPNNQKGLLKIRNTTQVPVIKILIERSYTREPSLVSIGSKAYVFNENESELEISIPRSVWDSLPTKNFKHKNIELGQKEYHLGELSISHPYYFWKALTKPNGELLGTYQNLYLFDN